jgi:hypothetical protein
MSASFAPECNQVKEYVDTTLFVAVEDTLTRSNGTVRVCDVQVSCHLEHELITAPEFVRGVAKEDECEPLFKEYKTCLTVWFSGMIFYCNHQSNAVLTQRV